MTPRSPRAAPIGVDQAVLLPGWGTPLERLVPLATDLEAVGVDAHLHDYRPEGSIEELGERLAELAPISVHRDRPLHLVGHSLGGLVCAAAALGPLAGRVDSVTTVNTPWRGTWLGYTGSGPLAESLRWSRAPLDRLRTRLTEQLAAPTGPRWHLVGTAGDLGVTVLSSLRGARGGERAHARLTTSVVWATGHSVSLLARRLRDTIVDGIVGVRALA